MEYRTITNEENDTIDLPSLTPFIHFENEDDPDNNEQGKERMRDIHKN